MDDLGLESQYEEARQAALTAETAINSGINSWHDVDRDARFLLERFMVGFRQNLPLNESFVILKNLMRVVGAHSKEQDVHTVLYDALYGLYNDIRANKYGDVGDGHQDISKIMATKERPKPEEKSLQGEIQAFLAKSSGKEAWQHRSFQHANPNTVLALTALDYLASLSTNVSEDSLLLMLKYVYQSVPSELRTTDELIKEAGVIYVRKDGADFKKEEVSLLQCQDLTVRNLAILGRLDQEHAGEPEKQVCEFFRGIVADTDRGVAKKQALQDYLLAVLAGDQPQALKAMLRAIENSTPGSETIKVLNSQFYSICSGQVMGGTLNESGVITFDNEPQVDYLLLSLASLIHSEAGAGVFVRKQGAAAKIKGAVSKAHGNIFEGTNTLAQMIAGDEVSKRYKEANVMLRAAYELFLDGVVDYHVVYRAIEFAAGQVKNGSEDPIDQALLVLRESLRNYPKPGVLAVEKSRLAGNIDALFAQHGKAVIAKPTRRFSLRKKETDDNPLLETRARGFSLTKPKSGLETLAGGDKKMLFALARLKIAADVCPDEGKLFDVLQRFYTKFKAELESPRNRDVCESVVNAYNESAKGQGVEPIAMPEQKQSRRSSILRRGSRAESVDNKSSSEDSSDEARRAALKSEGSPRSALFESRAAHDESSSEEEMIFADGTSQVVHNDGTRGERRPTAPPVVESTNDSGEDGSEAAAKTATKFN